MWLCLVLPCQPPLISLAWSSMCCKYSRILWKTLTKHWWALDNRAQSPEFWYHGGRYYNDFWRIVILMHSYITGFVRLMGLGCVLQSSDDSVYSTVHSDFECCRENLITERILFFSLNHQSLNKCSQGRHFSGVACYVFGGKSFPPFSEIIMTRLTYLQLKV